MLYEELTTNVTFRVTPEEKELLNYMQKVTGISKSDIVRCAVREYLTKEE